MTEPNTSEFPNDVALPFQVESLGVRGRLVRLGNSTEPVVRAGRYPEPVAALLLETQALTALLASALKYDGIFTLQIQGDGPVSLLVADITSEGDLRSYAKFDPVALDDAMTSTDGLLPHLLGAGHMAFTVDQGPDTERYQGITELMGTTLAECTANYFRQSEQLDTVIISAKASPPSRDGVNAAALMVQRLPASSLEGEDANEAWREAALLAGTVSPEELLNADLAGNDLLFNLYHERGVRAFDAKPLRHACRCSRGRVSKTLASFPRTEIEDMYIDDAVAVTCEYCGTEYAFQRTDLDVLFSESEHASSENNA
ncbi:MAG: molecular chaperone Hsp33 [Rhodospirillaceae bacterium]|jgi:molecular chaperone Hsp33|nr:molecular chaperone Hsp33 [Rhodospirillaceae bacterium]